MLNSLWAGMILIGIIFAAFTGRIPEITDAALDSSKEAVTLCITMIGVMAFWMGLMEIASKAGMIEKGAKMLKPFVRFLFPEVPEGHKAGEHYYKHYLPKLPRSWLGGDTRGTESHGGTWKTQPWKPGGE